MAASDLSNALCHLRDGVLASGDDSGNISVWDLRVSSTEAKDLCQFDLREHEDQITGLEFMNDHFLLSSSIDGHLGVFDLR